MYQLLFASTLVALATKVNAAIDRGFAPLGGPFWDGTRYIQALLFSGSRPGDPGITPE
jgi:hypothetical protein